MYSFLITDLELLILMLLFERPRISEFVSLGWRCEFAHHRDIEPKPLNAAVFLGYR